MNSTYLTEQAERIQLNGKPHYISALEDVILTLAPDEAARLATFVSALKEERQIESLKQIS